MKKIIKRIVAVLLILSILIIGLSGCGEKTYKTSVKDIKKKGTLIIGLDDTFAPMGFRDENNNLVGFDIDLARAVCKEMGVEAVFQPLNWGEKEKELNEGKIDCIWNGLSITPERSEKLAMSQPYLNNKIIIMTNEGVTIDELSDLEHQKIGIQSGSAALDAVKAGPMYSQIKDNIKEYPIYESVIIDMLSGKLDCMIVDEVHGKYKNDELENIFGVAKYDFGDDLYGIGFRSTDIELKEEINHILNMLTHDGIAGDISKKWFGEDIVVKNN